jgi:LysM repeat protein
MTIRQNALIQAACVSLLLAYSPGTAAAQDQGQPVSQETGSVAQPEQQPEAANVPADAPAVQEAPAAAEAEAPPAKEEFSEYTIKQGDTLWDIANAYLRDPFLWPFIWKANPSISNPDLIYAGDKLLIPALGPIERAMQAPEAAPQTQVAEEVEKKAPVEPKQPAPEEAKPVEGIAETRCS